MLKILRRLFLLIAFTFTATICSYSQYTWCCYDGIEYTIVSSDNAESEMSAADLIKSQSADLELTFIDANTGDPIYKESGIVVTVAFSNVILRVTTTQEYERIGFFGDVVTSRWGIAYFNIKGNDQSVNLNYNGGPFEPMLVPIAPYLQTTYAEDKFLSDYYHYTYKASVEKFDAIINVRAKNYEPRTITLTQETTPAFEDIALVQQITNVNLSGSVNVNNTNINPNQTNQVPNLDILTPKQIADALGLSESEVIDLIKSQKLKAKIIGDKYFIRKEDFELFMKN